MHKFRAFDWPGNEWDTNDKVIQRFEQVIKPQSNSQINKYVPELSNYRQTTESFTDFWTELKTRFRLAKDSVTRSCDERKNCAGCQQKSWEVELR